MEEFPEDADMRPPTGSCDLWRLLYFHLRQNLNLSKVRESHYSD